jgi:hypothetical protein
VCRSHRHSRRKQISAHSRVIDAVTLGQSGERPALGVEPACLNRLLIGQTTYLRLNAKPSEDGRDSAAMDAK